MNRSIPKPAACAAATASGDTLKHKLQVYSERGVGPPCDDPASGGEALDGDPPASADSTTALPLRRRRAPHNGGATLFTALSAAIKAGDRPLTLSVAPRITTWRPGVCEEPEPLPSLLRQIGEVFPAQSAFHRQVLLLYPRLHESARFHEQEPATILTVLPPRDGFRRSFAPPMLSHPEARSIDDCTGFSPMVARTARRLPTSAINTIRDHNMHDRPSPAHRSQGRPIRSSSLLQVAKLLSERSQPRVFGPGAVWFTNTGSSYHDRS